MDAGNPQHEPDEEAGEPDKRVDKETLCPHGGAEHGIRAVAPADRAAKGIDDLFVDRLNVLDTEEGIPAALTNQPKPLDELGTVGVVPVTGVHEKGSFIKGETAIL
ncbi:hypothetical protein D3C85_1447700 [compost metagenome]